ncbi:MAG: hypothetical protein H0V89_01075 [Deltaproteobacteria bacterium]|nr:hypothetical protein [Deltaproteobacteria bacterium]
MDRPGDRQLAWYALLAACAVVFRSELGILFNGTGHSNVTWSTWLPMAGVVAVFVRPHDLRALLVLYVGVLLDLANILPESPNHWLLTGLVGISWCVAAMHARVRGGRLPTGGALLRAVQPPFRVAIAAFYLCTGVWKLNGAFADPAISCGVRSWDRLVTQLPFLPSGPAIDTAVIGLTWVLELVGPVLLLVPVTRRPMVAIFALFHVVLALDIVQNYQNFSWAMLPLLLLFFEPEEIDAAARSWRADALLPVLRRGTALYFCGLVLLAWIAPEAWTNLRWTCSLTLASAVGVAFVALARRGALPRTPVRTSPAAWLLLALVVLNAATPVLGVKNRNAWQMYSNVRIEPEVTNHWFLPRSLDILGLQADRVEVLSIGDPLLRAEYVGSGLTLTWWDFRSLLAHYPETDVSWRRDGFVHTARSRDPDLAPPARLARMFVWFRPQGERVARQCQW